jgi:hypothetical protein
MVCWSQPTWINILWYIHFSTVCSERNSLKMGQLWRRIAGLGSHLIDLKIWDMILSQKCNNGNYLTFWNMKVVFFMHPNNHWSITPICYHKDNTTQHVFFRELNSTIFNWFWAPDHDCVLGFFPARQDFEIIGLLSVKNGLYRNI